MEKNKIKKRILTSLAISAICYLSLSFIKWDLLWIKEMPQYSQATRFVALFSYFLIQMPFQLIINEE